MAEIAMDRLPQPDSELHRQRPVEAVGDAQLRRQFLRRVGGQNRHQRIAGRDVHQQKAHQRHTDDDRNHIDDAASDIDEHLFTLLQSDRTSQASWPGLTRPSTSSSKQERRGCPGQARA
jgi:hypothetical protein